jgi:enoyl-CoA hydratase
MSDFVKCETAGPLTTITVNRPDCGNLVSNEMGAEIAAMIDAAAGSRLIVLRGAGDNFCLGRDAAALRAAGPFKTALDMRRGNTEPALGIVQGRAIGFGCALAGLCDITIASDDAQFQLPEMDHGIPPCLAMSALLGNLAPKAIMYLVYSTEQVNAERALAMGLVSKVVPRRELEKEADAFIKKTLGRVPASVPAVKEYMRSAPRMEPQAAADFGSTLLSGVLSSAEH